MLPLYCALCPSKRAALLVVGLLSIACCPKCRAFVERVAAT